MRRRRRMKWWLCSSPVSKATAKLQLHSHTFICCDHTCLKSGPWHVEPTFKSTLPWRSQVRGRMRFSEWNSVLRRDSCQFHGYVSAGMQTQRTQLSTTKQPRNKVLVTPNSHPYQLASWIFRHGISNMS